MSYIKVELCRNPYSATCWRGACTLCEPLLWQGGLPKKHQDTLRRELLHTYGHEYLRTLSLLQAAGAAHCRIWHGTVLAVTCCHVRCASSDCFFWLAMSVLRVTNPSISKVCCE